MALSPVDLVMASDQVEPDDAIFRVGGIKLQAFIGEPDGELEEFDCAGITTSHQIGALAVAKQIVLPLGVAVDEVGPSGVIQATRDKYKSVVKFNQIRIEATFSDVETDDVDIGQTNSPGTWVVFDGVISSVSASTSAKSAVSLVISALSGNATIATAASVVPFMGSSAGYVLDISFKSGRGTVMFEPGNFKDLWTGVYQSIYEKLINGRRPNLEHTIRQSSKALTDVMDEAIRVSGAEEALKRVVSHLQVRGDLLDNALNNVESIFQMVGNVVNRSTRDPNGLHAISSSLLTVASALIDVAGELHATPVWPYPHRDQIRAIPAGVIHHASVSVGAGSATSLTSTGTVGIACAVTEIKTSSSWRNQGELYVDAVGGFYVHDVPDKIKRFGAVILEPSSVVAGIRGPGLTVTDDKDQIPPHTKATGASVEEVKSNPSSIGPDISSEYARFRVLESLFGGNTFSMTMPLRTDIVPGTVVRINLDRFGEEASGDSAAIYAMANVVSPTISAGQTPSASMTVHFTHARDAEEQDVIENGIPDHYLFNSPAEALNGLSLWKEA